MTTDGPSPSRIVAAGASVAAGIGLVALLAGTADGPPDVVVQVEPAPVIVQAAEPAPTPMTPTTAAAPAPDQTVAKPIQAATPAPARPAVTAPAPQAVTESEGS